jgi:hypothetical protein
MKLRRSFSIPFMGRSVLLVSFFSVQLLYYSYQFREGKAVLYSSKRQQRAKREAHENI